MDPLPDSLIEKIASARRVVVSTGAGVSAESGVPTFRGAEGLWKNFRAEELATPEAFSRDPGLVWEWYAWRRDLIAGCRPNPAHEAIAALGDLFDDFVLVTQNVDGLHRIAGSKRLLELHGCLWDLRCVEEGTVREDRTSPLMELPPRCGCGAGRHLPGHTGSSLTNDRCRASRWPDKWCLCGLLLGRRRQART